MKIAKNSAATRMKSKVRKWNDQKHDEIPEVINRATRRAAASMKRKQKENN